MDRFARIPPAYPKKPHTSGQARIRLRGRDIYLGVHGSVESLEAYERAIAEFRASGFARPTKHTRQNLTVADLVARFLVHAKEYYQSPDGTAAEVREYKVISRILLKLYGTLPAGEFGPLCLKTVRQAMIDQGLARKTINQRIGRVRRLFKWAASDELVSAEVWHALEAVAGLRSGRTSARDRPPVQAVSDDTVTETLPHLHRIVAAMVQVQRLTGMRAGELVIMRPVDIDRNKPVWVYTPTAHKTAWKGFSKWIAIGPRAQAVLAPFLERLPESFCFSPAEAMTEIRAARRLKRKTPVQPSQRNRKKRRPEKQPGERYSVGTYSRMVREACERHNIPSWHPHQLRHAAATAITREFGLDGSRAVLGHQSAQVTTIYAHRDLEAAADIAAKVG